MKEKHQENASHDLHGSAEPTTEETAGSSAAGTGNAGGSDNKDKNEPSNGGINGSEAGTHTGGNQKNSIKDLEDLIKQHSEGQPAEGLEEEIKDILHQPDTEKPSIITDLFITAFLVRILNRVLTGFNVLLFNMLMKRRGKVVDYKNVLLTDEELKPLEILVDRYAPEIIKKYLPEWAQALIFIEFTYIDKMIDQAE